MGLMSRAVIMPNSNVRAQVVSCDIKAPTRWQIMPHNQRMPYLLYQMLDTGCRCKKMRVQVGIIRAASLLGCKCSCSLNKIIFRSLFLKANVLLDDDQLHASAACCATGYVHLVKRSWYWMKQFAFIQYMKHYSCK